MAWTADKRARLTLTIAAVTASGCVPHTELAVAPDIISTHWSQPPASPAGVPASAPPQADPAQPMPADLGIAFASPELSGLIARAGAVNTDVAIAAARIRQARALLRVARGAMLPIVS